MKPSIVIGLAFSLFFLAPVSNAHACDSGGCEELVLIAATAPTVLLTTLIAPGVAKSMAQPQADEVLPSYGSALGWTFLASALGGLGSYALIKNVGIDASLTQGIAALVLPPLVAGSAAAGLVYATKRRKKPTVQRTGSARVSSIYVHPWRDGVALGLGGRF